MSRYIDAEWLKELYKPYESYNGKELAVPIGAILANIDDAPSIDIVRCKECIHNPWDFDRLDYTCIWDDDFADRPQTPDDFCSYGERREDKE